MQAALKMRIFFVFRYPEGIILEIFPERLEPSAENNAAQGLPPPEIAEEAAACKGGGFL